MLTSVAFVVCQVRLVDWPFSTVFGFADKEAVGAGGGGGGGGGGGATFFAQAPKNRIALSTNTRVTHFFIGCFTSFLQISVRPDCGVPCSGSRLGALFAGRKTVLLFKINLTSNSSWAACYSR